MKPNFFKTMGAVAALAVFMACAGGTGLWQLPARHHQDPDEDLRYCTDCHDASDDGFPYQRFVHTLFFAENHRPVALQHQQVCAMCHQPSACDECHGVRVELKPSLKNPTRTWKRTPHRGDYLSRHRIDGRVDPVACIRCHGNPKTTQTCRPCHG